MGGGSRDTMGMGLRRKDMAGSQLCPLARAWLPAMHGHHGEALICEVTRPPQLGMYIQIPPSLLCLCHDLEMDLSHGNQVKVFTGFW